MSRADFELIRKVAADRSLVFVPEYQLVQKFKVQEDENKSSARLPEDDFRDALGKLFASNDEEKADLSELVKNVRHIDSLDAAVLAVAAKFYRRFPAGINTSSIPNARSLSQTVTLSQEMDFYAREVLQLHGIQGIDDLPRIKADILAYYLMIVDSTH